MKKITLPLLLLFMSSFVLAQEKNNFENEIKYNKWSVDFGVGANKPTKPFATGYYADALENISAEVAARYMFNDKFGLKLGAVYNNFQEGDNSLEFDTDFTHFNLDAVLNLGSVLSFRDFSDRFGLLFSAGLGYGILSYSESPTLDEDDTDNLLTVNGVLTPQYKLSDKLALNLNLGVAGLTDIENINFTNPDNTLDGNGTVVTPGFTGVNYRATIGLTVYLGNQKEHADWADVSETKQVENKAEQLEDRVAQLEEDLEDEDKDGVPAYLDREPNTPNGVRVGNKGIALDKNNNEIPDDLETALNEKYTTKESTQMESKIMKTFANRGYVNIYFKFDSSQPEYYSLNAITQIMEYMKANPETTATLTGYTDSIGNKDYNMKLSKDRAETVYKILIASGIDESRLSYKGGGIDDSVDKSSDEARQMTRRVKFELK